MPIQVIIYLLTSNNLLSVWLKAEIVCDLLQALNLFVSEFPALFSNHQFFFSNWCKGY
jgi:hypothetical protein